MREVTLRTTCAVLALAVLSTAGPVAAQGRPTVPRNATVPRLDADQVMRVLLGGEGPREAMFRLSAQKGQGVIIDLVPAGPALTVNPAPADLPSAEQAASDDAELDALFEEASSRTLLLEVLSPSGASVRKITSDTPERGRATSEVERGAENGALRIALYPAESGNYQVRARSEASAPTPFELIVRPRDLPPPPRPPEVRDIAVGAERRETLEAGVPSLFKFSTEQPGQFVRIDLKSEAFDPKIELVRGEGADGPGIADDDDGGEGLDARLLTRLSEPGTYTIIARPSLDDNGSGAFTLKVETFQPKPVAERLLAEGETMGTFNGQDEGFPVDAFRGAYHLYFMVGEEGQRFTVAMKTRGGGKRLDPILQAGVPAVVTSGATPDPQDIAVVAENDDADDDNLDSRIDLYFAKRQKVLIRAGAVGNIEPRGEYTITLTRTPVTVPSAGIAPAATVARISATP